MTDSLQTALEQHRLTLSPEQTELVDRYCLALWDWNTKLNLTRHTDYEKFVARDLRDSAELAALLQPHEEVLDIGSGGGVPGILLAILRPDLQVTLSESVGKKASVLRQMLETLDLQVAVQNCRGEELLEDFRFDSVVARAVGPLDKMLSWFPRRQWMLMGRLLAIKGPRWPEERDEAARRGLLRGLELKCAAHYPLFGTEAESVILEIRRAA